jgi:hypothetical protein
MIFAGMIVKNSCPEDDMFVRAFMRELTFEENERFIDHILVCAECRKKFETLKQLSGELSGKMDALEAEKLSPEEAEELKELAQKKIGESKRKRTLIFGWVPVKYMAAAAVLFAAVVGLYVVLKMGQREVYREEAKKPALVLIEPSGKVPLPPEIFVWTAYEGAAEYTFELIDDELNTLFIDDQIWESKLVLPDEVVKKLEKGRTYVWKVLAEDEDSNILESARIYFEIK